MRFTNGEILMKNDATLEVTASEYAKLVLIADRYHTIIELAFRKTSLNWRGDGGLNGDDVCEYIGFIEQRRTETEKARLLADKKKQEAAK